MTSKDLIIETFKSGIWVNEKIQDVLKPFDLSIQQFNVLRILRGQQPNAANLSDIQERMISKMSNTTRLVDKLIQKELTHRITCPENRRKVEITITKKGLHILKQIDPLIEEREAQMTEKLSAHEINTITTLLQKLKD